MRWQLSSPFLCTHPSPSQYQTIIPRAPLPQESPTAYHTGGGEGRAPWSILSPPYLSVSLPHIHLTHSSLGSLPRLFLCLAHCHCPCQPPFLSAFFAHLFPAYPSMLISYSTSSPFQNCVVTWLSIYCFLIISGMWISLNKMISLEIKKVALAP